MSNALSYLISLLVANIFSSTIEGKIYNAIGIGLFFIIFVISEKGK